MTDERPPVWIGHALLPSNDVPRALEWWKGTGMRFIASGDTFAVLELRGGTHVVLLHAEEPIAAGTACPFDLMVEDIDAAHRDYAARGCSPSALERGRIHTSFVVRDPSGYDVTVNSSHASDRPV
jgi:catechol 2,3-dioxygenase-like lactoylglutathione lyase family enzyme